MKDGSLFENRLCAMIDEGHMPLLSMDPTAPDLDLCLEKFNGLQRFTVISHVWSNGMGNDMENAFPFCQLSGIARELTALQNERYHSMTEEKKVYPGYLLTRYSRLRRVYFWIDTLCIPARQKVQVGIQLDDTPAPSLRVAPLSQNRISTRKLSCDSYSDEMFDKNSDAEATRKVERDRIRSMAIRHVTPIFQAAEQAIVIDKELELLSQPSEDELSTKLFSSKWAQRAWTFQEATLARDCRYKIYRGTPAGLRTLNGPELPIWMLGRIHDRGIHKNNPEVAIRTLQRFFCSLRGKYTGAQVLFPEDREYSQFWTPLKWIHAGTLNSVRKLAVRSGRTRKDEQHYLSSISNRLVHVHHNLLRRSATWKTDPLLITANLLDFDSAKVSKLDVRDRILTILRSRPELPLSLLFNSGLSVYPECEPWNSWVPTKIEGDALVEGCVLRNPQVDGGHDTDLYIDSDSVSEALVSVITESRTTYEPHSVPRVRIQNQERKYGLHT